MRRFRADRGKAIIFCHDITQADRMCRELIDLAPDWTAADPEWVVQITGDQEEKARWIEDLSDVERDSPLVATTSRLLATGIDIEDLKYVVLFRPVGSQVEFKQIVGRGTRLYPDKGKTSFEIIDFVGASEHFQDPSFDGFPDQVIKDEVNDDGTVVEGAGDDEPEGASVSEPEPGFEVTDPTQQGRTDGDAPGGDSGDGFDGVDPAPRTPYIVDEGSFEILAEALQIPDTSTGQLRLTNYGDYVARQVRLLADTPDELATLWCSAEQRDMAVAMLREHQIDVETLAGPKGEDIDVFDLLLNVAWNQPTRTRAERVKQVRKRHHEELERKFGVARKVLEALLDRYAEQGIEDVTSIEVLNLPPISDLGSRREVVKQLGGGEEWRKTVATVQEWIYSTETVA